MPWPPDGPSSLPPGGLQRIRIRKLAVRGQSESLSLLTRCEARCCRYHPQLGCQTLPGDRPAQSVLPQDVGPCLCRHSPGRSFGVDQFSSVAQSCPTLCNPMDCSMPGFPVHHQLQELTQTHVHQVGDAIQPSQLLSSPSPFAFNLSTIRIFSNESVLCMRWPKHWSFSFSISPSNEHPGLISFRMDSLQSKGLSRAFSNTTVQNHQFLLNFRFAAWMMSSGLFPLLRYKALSSPSPLLLRIQVLPASSDLLL